MATTEDQEYPESGTETPESLSIEIILRKSYVDSFKEYVLNSSLAGTNQMWDPKNNLCMRIIWTTIFFLKSATVCYFLYFVWTATLNKPLIVNLESKQYPIGDINFPAVAICNVNRISKKALAKLAADEYNDLADKESLEEVENILLNLGRLNDFSYNETTAKSPVYLKMIEKYRFNTDKIIDIMKQLTPSCEESLVRCAWAGNLVNCSEIFTIRRTANRGYCCTFNYVLNYNVEAKNPEANSKEIKRQSVPGFLQGLFIILDPLLEDYAYPLNNILGFDVLIFDPLHFADPSAGRVNHYMNEPNHVTFLELDAIRQTATREIRKYSVDTRRCLFHDELSEEFYNRYSYSTCIVKCRLETVQSLCKCTPYFFAVNKVVTSKPICTLEDLPCLNKYREKLFYLYPFDAETSEGLETELEDSLMCEHCLPDCEITQYITKAFETPMTTDNVKKALHDTLLTSIDMENKSLLTIYHPTADATWVQLDVVTYWYEVVSNIGGFCGIIVGFSIVNIFEGIYFFTIRYVRHVIANYQKYH